MSSACVRARVRVARACGGSVDLDLDDFALNDLGLLLDPHANRPPERLRGQGVLSTKERLGVRACARACVCVRARVLESVCVCVRACVRLRACARACVCVRVRAQAHAPE